MKAANARFRRLAMEGAWTVAGQVMMIFGMLLSVKVLTTQLSTAQYGELALGLTLTVLTTQLIYGPLGQGITRYYAPAAESEELIPYLGASQRLIVRATSGVLVLIALAVIVTMALGEQRWFGFMVTTFVYSITSGCNAILYGVRNAARQRKIVAAFQGIDPWFRLAVAMVLISLWGPSSSATMAGFAIASFIILILQCAVLARTLSPGQSQAPLSLKYHNQILQFSWPFAAWGVFTWAQICSDRWALAYFGTTSDVGLYVVLFQLGYHPISLAGGMATQFIMPILYQRSGDASNQRRNLEVRRMTFKLAAAGLALTAIATILAALFHSEIFQLFAAPTYRSVSYLVPLMTMAGGVFAVGQILSLDIMSRIEVKILLNVKVISALAGVAMSIFGAHFFGVEGVAIACLGFGLTYLLWISHLVARPRS